MFLGLVGVYWAGSALWSAVAGHVALSITVIVATLAGTALVLAVRYRVRRHREQLRIHRTHTLDQILALNSTSFEFFTADLLRRDGCTRVERVGGAGDLAADNLARLPDGRKLLVQDKFYALSNPVGSPDLQKVGGTYRVIHGADVAIAITTSHFTPAAVGYARQAGIILVDRERLAGWAAGGPPPWR